MSETDSFIEEVTEEVRRDRLFALLRRYGWIAIVAIVLLVGGAAWNEWRKAQAEARAQALGDALMAALELDGAEDRVGALGAISTDSAGGQAIVAMLLAAEETSAGDPEAAVAALNDLAVRGDVPEIYRQIAAFKALVVGAGVTPAEARKSGLQAMANPGSPFRVLAEEQLALIDIEQGARDAAIDKFQRIIADAEATQGLRDRARQMIVALGGVPDTLPGEQNQ